jgi:hypothetical protein
MPPSFSSLQGRQVRWPGPVQPDVASGPRVGISAGIPARVRGARDGGSGSAPDPEDSQIGSGIDCCVDDCHNFQSHFCVGIWPVFCRCSHGDAAGGHLPLADTQALQLERTRKCGDDVRCTNAPKIVGEQFKLGATRS